MLGLDNYASDSDDETQDVRPTSLQKDSPSAPKSGLNSQPPSSSSTQSSLTAKSSGLNLPPPKAKKAAAPKKIVVALPKLEKHGSDSEEEDRPAKKARTTGGSKGASALLSMLPAPKKASVEPAAPQRVLGGGRPGIVYTSNSAHTSTSGTEGGFPDVEAEESSTRDEETTRTMLPPSLMKGKSRVEKLLEKKEDTADFFSLGTRKAY